MPYIKHSELCTFPDRSNSSTRSASLEGPVTRKTTAHWVLPKGLPLGINYPNARSSHSFANARSFQKFIT